MAFEGHRPQDLFGNNRPLIRADPDLHSLERFNQNILPTDYRVVFYIPEREVIVNPNFTQNIERNGDNHNVILINLVLKRDCSAESVKELRFNLLTHI